VSVHDDLKQAYLELRSQFGVGITFGTAPEIQALVSEAAMSRELVTGGAQESVDYIARVLIEDLPAEPVLGSPVTYSGLPLKIHKRLNPQNHPIGEFMLISTRR